jgi:hypothetical protein
VQEVKIFNKVEGWGDKVNFVDKHNTIVGYDLSQSCCENAGWYISFNRRMDTNDAETVSSPEVLSQYDFDKGFIEEIDGGIFDQGGMVRFRLVRDRFPDLFLHIFNSHNGYYSHGFTVHHGGELVKDSAL